MVARVDTSYFPREWAEAIREDALVWSTGGVARERIGMRHKLIEPHRVTVRIGALTRDRALVSYGQLGRPNVWLRAAPVCQDCGYQIEHGSHAIEFRFSFSGRSRGRVRFLHEECPCLA